MSSLAAIAVADVAGAVLAGAGLVKLRQPRAFASLISGFGLPVSTARARVVGAAEIAIAATAVVAGGRAAFAAIAVVYAAFALISTLSVTRGTSCGCFGVESAPTTWAHVMLDVMFAAASLIASVGSTPSLAHRLGKHPAQVSVYVLFVGLGAYLSVAVMTSAATVSSLRKRVAR